MNTPMNTMSKATIAPAHFSDAVEPAEKIPEIAPIGDRAAIEAQSDDVLTAKLKDYQDAEPKLVAHHAYQRDRFDAAYQHFVKIFTSIETLESLKQTAEAIAPGFDLLEEFSLIPLPEELDGAANVVGNVALYSGAVSGVAAMVKSFWEVSKARGLVSVAQGKPIGAANSAGAISKAKVAARWKVLGAAGAALTVGSAAVGIIEAVENAKRRRAFLVNGTESQQNWYETTRQAISDLEAGADEMEADITELMALLGYGTPEELEAALGAATQTAGEVQGALRTATRMLCAEPPVAPAQVALFTGLPEGTVNRRKALIDADPNLCTLV